MKLSKRYRVKLKKRVTIILCAMALLSIALVISKLTNFSTPIQMAKNASRMFFQETQIIEPTEKEEKIEDYSSSSLLNNIYINGSAIQGFTPQKLTHGVVYKSQLDTVEISVDKQDEGQEVSGTGEITLTGEAQSIELTVTSADKANVTTYTIYISYQLEETSSDKIYDFEYTGDYQEFEAPYTGYYQIECWGAQGGSYSGVGGNGAYTSGNIYLEKGQKIYVYVGQSGADSYEATFNGGGLAATSYYERAGGGATDIRLSSGAWDDFDSLKSRIMVAAGGGGSVGPSYSCNGGPGGALYGYNGSRGGNGTGYTVAGGATQTSVGTPGSGAVVAIPGGFGYGGSQNANHGGGGRRRLLWWRPEDVITLV